ncbi:MAG: plastocyanin/azurin family copper-binding protein [Candidatus Limnocylindrales bacterium]
MAQLPSPSPGPSATASPRPPGPPDPGEPGFVAGTKAKPRVINIAVSDLLLFDPTVVSVQQGETIRFRITNAGTAEHEFKVGPMQDVFDDVPSTPEVAGITHGSTKELTYTFSGTGPYAYACHAPGHFENGMFGFVNVIPTVPWIGTVAHPRMIVIRMDDHLEFVPSEVSVTPGETILFVLPNVGTSLTHEFQVGPADRVALDQADGQIVVEVDKIEPLHVDYLIYTFGGVGPYAFACHEPGHYEAGMKGVIDLSP